MTDDLDELAESGTDVPAKEVDRPTGTTSLDADMRLEPELLAIAAVRQISADIADRVDAISHGARRPVILVEDALAGAMSQWRHASVGMEALQDALKSLLDDAAKPAKSKKSSTKESFVETTAGTVSSALAALSEVLSWLRVDSTWSGRTLDLDGVLQPALVGQLVAKGFRPYLFDYSTNAASSVSGLDDHLLAMRDLLELRYSVEGLRPAGPKAPSEEGGEGGSAESAADPLTRRIDSLIDSTDMWLVSTFGGDDREASRFARIFDGAKAVAFLRANPTALLLHTRLLKAGGHYRTKRHIFSTLFGHGPLSYSGGAAVSFTLVDPAAGRTLLSDVLFHYTGEVQFREPANTVVKASNLQAKALADGFASLETSVVPAQPATHPAKPAHIPKAPPAATSQPGIDERQQQDNVGDDEEADTTQRRVPSVGTFEAAREWRVAESLLTLRKQINQAAPNRSKLSDGAIGDAEHATRNSDHNPWIIDGNKGVVTAIDITNDKAGGCDADAVAESLCDARDPRIKYIIWNKRIAASSEVKGVAAWTWRDYTGRNDHTHHIHISVQSDKAHYDSTAAWQVKTRK